MTSIRARNLFTAILVARAICGLGIGYANYTDQGGTSGGGRIITGTGTVSGLASFLTGTAGASYNEVTLDTSANSTETLPFVNESGDVLGNILTNQGLVTTLDDAVLFSGDTVGDNTVTNSGTLDSQYGPGLFFEGRTAISDNTIVNSGSITAGDSCVQIFL